MELIRGLQVPIFTRKVWNTAALREEWEPRIQAIDNQWAVVERGLVLAGRRGCALQPLTRLQYLDMLSWTQRNGLSMRLVRSVKKWEGFAHHYIESSDDSGYLVTAIGRPDALDQPEQNLGYPDCCQAFFARTFPKGYADPVWQWAGGDTQEGRSVRLDSVSPFSNPLLRYINVRFSPHIPCGPQCPKSIDLGTAAAELMDPVLAAQMEELLSLPTTWDCYRGVAIIKNPIFTLVAGSMPTASKYEVRANVR